MDTGHDDWQPPSETAMKLIEARRERSDKISKLMGDYLLKGYKMLGTTCIECDTILLQTKQGENYCIACSELDSDADKDDPVTNQAAALAQAREREVPVSPPRQASSTQPFRQLASGSILPQSYNRPSAYSQVSSTSPTGAAPSVRHQGVNSSANAAKVSFTDSVGSVRAEAGDGARNVGSVRAEAGDVSPYVQGLLDKLDWAVAELRETRSVEHSIQLCQLVKAGADAVAAVRRALES